MIYRRLFGCFLSVLLSGCIGNTVQQPPPSPFSPLIKPLAPILMGPPIAAAGTVAKTAVSGQTAKFFFATQVNPDCTSAGLPTVRITAEPSHGKMVLSQGTDYPFYPSSNQRYACNVHRVPGIAVLYTSEAGYIGPDQAAVNVIGTDGFERTANYLITVK